MASYEIDPETGKAYSAASWEWIQQAIAAGWTVKIALFSPNTEKKKDKS